jgi:hypothetical protein
MSGPGGKGNAEIEPESRLSNCKTVGSDVLGITTVHCWPGATMQAPAKLPAQALDKADGKMCSDGEAKS